MERGAKPEAPLEFDFDNYPWWDPGDVLTQITPDRYSYLKSVAGDLAGKTALDLGCGGGMLSEPLARDGARVCGADISIMALRQARLHAKGISVSYLQARGEALPYRDETFDLVLAFDVLEHVSSLETTIAEVSRVLRPQGKLVFDTVNRTFLSRLVVIWIGEHLWQGGPPRGTHLWHQFIRPRSLEKLLQQNGMRDVATRGFVPLPDLKGKMRMRLLPFRGISYVGYGIKF